MYLPLLLVVGRLKAHGMITLSVHWTCCRPVTHAQTWA